MLFVASLVVKSKGLQFKEKKHSGGAKIEKNKVHQEILRRLCLLIPFYAPLNAKNHQKRVVFGGFPLFSLTFVGVEGFEPPTLPT